MNKNNFPKLLKQNSNFFDLNTKDLELRLYEKKDVKARFNILHEFPEITETMSFFPPQKIEEILEHFSKIQESFNDSKLISWNIFYKQKFIGTISLEGIVWKSLARTKNKGFIGYWLSPKFHGRGFMTQALKEVLKLVFTQLQLNKVDIWCLSKNTASRRVIEKAGFRFLCEKLNNSKRNGKWENHLQYELLKSEWKLQQTKKSFIKFKNPRRGEVWIVDLGSPFGSEQGQKRPCVILNTPRKKEKTVLIAPSSKTIRPQSMKIRNYQFLCFQTRVVDRKRLCGRICRLSVEETDLVADKVYSIIKNETQI